jgi:uncharacterized protein (TIGR03643 family)
MGISSRKKAAWNGLTSDECDRVVRMAWEDRTSFESIEKQFGLSPNDVERFMRTQLDPKAYKRWRRRASEQGQLKQAKLRPLRCRDSNARARDPMGPLRAKK